MILSHSVLSLIIPDLIFPVFLAYGQKNVFCVWLTIWLCGLLQLIDGRSGINREKFKQYTKKLYLWNTKIWKNFVKTC
jgi:L-asparagine transporter-like permease